MSALSLLQASEIYQYADTAHLEWHRVHSVHLQQYAQTLTALKVSLGDAAHDDLWQEVLNRTFAYQYRACSAPLPLNHSAFRGAETLQRVSALIRSASRMYPDHAVLAQLVCDQLSTLTKLHENPLLLAIAEMLDFESGQDAAIVLNRTLFVPSLKSLLEQHPVLEALSVIGEAQAEDVPQFNRLFVIGASHWYREGLLTAPRAPSIDMLRYGFVRDRWSPQSAFVAPRPNGHWKLARLRPLEVDTSQTGQIDVGPLAVDVRQILQRVSTEIPVRQHEHVEARLLLLVGEAAVLLDADEDSWALVIDLTADEGSRVRRVSVPKIEAGMYILLRTEGGGDYILPVADRILGDRAQTARWAQELWKRRLRNKVETLGLQRVAQDLRTLGSPRANEQNARNWISERMIRTRDYHDFLAILRYTGLDERATDMWKLMGDIRTAHLKAGQEIRTLLLQQVAKADLTALQTSGTMDFELPGEDSGALTAYRVEEVAAETVTVSHADVGRVFDSGSGAWRA